MSLIYWNNKNLNDIALINLEHNQGKISYSQDGDLITLKAREKVVGFNVLNASKYLKLIEGAHNINQEHIAAIKNNFQVNLEKHNTSSMLVVGEITSRKVHPKSDKLFVLKVNINEEIQIVTNSINSVIGAKVVVALPGAILPTGLEIKESKVMGIPSYGMLCGAQTLGLEKTDGVYLLKDKDYGDVFVI